MKSAVLAVILLCALAVLAQDCSSPATNGKEASPQPVSGLKDVVVTSAAQPSSVIAVPPVEGVTFGRGGRKPDGEQVDLAPWIRTVTSSNGLESADVKPWHIVVTYDQFDGDGDNTNSGIYEEFWAGPKMFKRVIKSNDLTQTDYASARGLYRLGDQRWSRGVEDRVRAVIIDPFLYIASATEIQLTKVQRSFGESKLDCFKVSSTSNLLMSNMADNPFQYCFEPGSSVLRYSRSDGWHQNAYNGIVSFQGRNLARDVVVTDGKKPFLKLRMELIENIQNINEADFVPPPEATSLSGTRIKGVNPKVLKSEFPRPPASLRGQHWTAQVELVIGKDGRVLSAQTIGGPPEVKKACEDAARNFRFAPYLILGEPVEVETTISFAMN